MQIKRADLKCGMSTLKTGHYKKDYHEVVTTRLYLLYHGF